MVIVSSLYRLNLYFQENINTVTRWFKFMLIFSPNFFTNIFKNFNFTKHLPASVTDNYYTIKKWTSKLQETVVNIGFINKAIHC